VDQLRQDFWGGDPRKCYTYKALDFLTLQFGTRGSEVQILSPRPLFSRNYLGPLVFSSTALSIPNRGCLDQDLISTTVLLPRLSRFRPNCTRRVHSQFPKIANFGEFSLKLARFHPA